MKRKLERLSEEMINAVTHGLGTGLAMVGLILLVLMALGRGTTNHLVGFTIFGLTLVVLYLASTIYHSSSTSTFRLVLRKVDHISIFLLIAGTYTPFCLVALPGWIGWTVLTIVWFCAALGIFLKASSIDMPEGVSTFLYVMMGWLIIPAIKPLYDSVTVQTFILLMAGGFFYTTGTYFFLKDHKRFFHGIWHLFVMVGSTLHFFSVVSLLG